MEAHAQQTTEQICFLKEQVTSLSLIYTSPLEKNNDKAISYTGLPKFTVLYCAIMFLKQYNIPERKRNAACLLFVYCCAVDPENIN